MCGEPSLAATILRLPMVYGPGDPLHRFHAFLKRMDERTPCHSGYVEDVGAAEAGALSWADWARAIGEAAGWQGRIVTLPRDGTPKRLIPPVRAQQHWTADSSRIRHELGHRESIPRAEAQARTVAGARQSGALRRRGLQLPGRKSRHADKPIADFALH